MDGNFYKTKPQILPLPASNHRFVWFAERVTRRGENLLAKPVDIERLLALIDQYC